MRTTEETMELRAMPGMIAMVNAAKDWLNINSDETPEFSIGNTGTIFNDNDAADQIEDVIVEAGEKSGISVAPEDIWNAVVFALSEKNLR